MRRNAPLTLPEARLSRPSTGNPNALDRDRLQALRAPQDPLPRLARRDRPLFDVDRLDAGNRRRHRGGELSPICRPDLPAAAVHRDATRDHRSPSGGVAGRAGPAVGIAGRRGGVPRRGLRPSAAASGLRLEGHEYFRYPRRGATPGTQGVWTRGAARATQ